MPDLLELFWVFIKINLLSTSGPASVGLLYKQTVGSLLSEAQFVEAVGLSNALPGSDALQLAMFVGYSAAGIPGALVALLGSVIPPIIVLWLVLSILQRLRQEAWVGGFVRGLSPAVGMLMVFVAYQLLTSNRNQLELSTVWIAVGSFVALIMKISPPLVLLLAGIIGAFLY